MKTILKTSLILFLFFIPLQAQSNNIKVKPITGDWTNMDPANYPDSIYVEQIKKYYYEKFDSVTYKYFVNTALQPINRQLQNFRDSLMHLNDSLRTELIKSVENENAMLTNLRFIQNLNDSLMANQNKILLSNEALSKSVDGYAKSVTFFQNFTSTLFQYILNIR